MIHSIFRSGRKFRKRIRTLLAGNSGSNKNAKKMYWSIGIFEGDTIRSLSPINTIRNPVLSAQQVTDLDAEFVADPFVLQYNGIWYMFFEVLNTADQKV